jgi:flagellar assembly factor FliW
MSTVVMAHRNAETPGYADGLPSKVRLIGGLLPFKAERFRLEQEKDAPPFLRLAAEDVELDFHVIEPFVVDPNYAPEVRDEDWVELGFKNEGEKPLVLCVVNLTRGVGEATINLAGPILINPQNGRGKQLALGKQIIPLNAADYSPRRRILSEQERKGD